MVSRLQYYDNFTQRRKTAKQQKGFSLLLCCLASLRDNDYLCTFN